MKTAELKGIALDWAVAKCEGLLEPRESFGRMVTFVVLEPAGFGDNRPTLRLNSSPQQEQQEYSPSTDWSEGGLIIEQEKIGIDCDDQGVWFASYDLSSETAWGATGKTPLIAAMRCYAATKLGKEVEIPAELTEEN